MEGSTQRVRPIVFYVLLTNGRVGVRARVHVSTLCARLRVWVRGWLCVCVCASAYACACACAYVYVYKWSVSSSFLCALKCSSVQRRLHIFKEIFIYTKK